MSVETIFKNKKPDFAKLEKFGFVKSNNEWQYHTKIADEQLCLHVVITDDGKITAKITDVDFDEEYTLHLSSAAEGKFVGLVRSAYEETLRQIADICFVTEVFRQKQTKALIAYVRQTYGDELEYLWPKFTDNAVWRRKDTQKWYAVILTVARNKLGLDGDEPVEVIDLRIDKQELQALIDNKKYFAGYHMNKRSWLTICLDGSVDLSEIKQRLDESYRLAAKK